MTTSTRGGTVLSLLISVLAAGCATAPAAGDKIAKPADLERLKTLGGKANGVMVWTSSRAGAPHLFTMKTDAAEVKQLTKGDMTDWYPRLSPDGSKVLFSRSREEGFVREAEASADGAWDLYTVKVDGTEIGKVVENATWGTWIGADEILFQRGHKILRTKLGSDDESPVLDTAAFAELAGRTVQGPELSPDGKYIALSLVDNRTHEVGVWNLRHKEWNRIGAGSQINWAPDGASVIWLDFMGKGFGRILRVPVKHGKPAPDVDPARLVLLDVMGKRSHEGFPRLSRDGQWLTFGAALTGQANDLEDYELYLWEVGSPLETSARLTFHGANDRWPDLYVPPSGTALTPGSKTKGGADANQSPQTEKSKTEKIDKLERLETDETN